MTWNLPGRTDFICFDRLLADYSTETVVGPTYIYYLGTRKYYRNIRVIRPFVGEFNEQAHEYLSA